MSRPTDAPPYIVEIHDGDIVTARVLFTDHDQACVYAVDALRLALPPARP